MFAKVFIVSLAVVACVATPVAEPESDEEPVVEPKHTRAGGAPPVVYTDKDLNTLSEELYRLDQQGNAASINQHWTVNTRSTNGKLFTKLDKTVFERPTYKKLIALLDNYEPSLGVAENETPAEKQEQSAFLDAVIETPVVQKAWEFLKKKLPKDVVPTDKAGFKALLQRIWFVIYRRRGQPDTSGFEHVFVGEVGSASTDGVEGFHNWIQYALEEDKGRVKYGRWKGQNDPDLYGMQFTWNGRTKIKSTIAIGESPEMSIAMLTTCFMVAPEKLCKVSLGGALVNIQTFKWDNRANPKEFYVASAYYDN